MNLLHQHHNQRFIAFALCGLGLLSLVGMGLLIPILSGLFAYQMVHIISRNLLEIERKDQTMARKHSARKRAGSIIGACLFVILVGLLSAVHYSLRDGANIQALLIKLGDIAGSAKAVLPSAVAEHIPAQDALFETAGSWLKSHAALVGNYGLMTVKGIGFALLGILLGSMVAIAEAKKEVTNTPVTRLFLDQMASLKDYFWLVATAQVKISAINATCTAFYLYVILPAFGVDLGFRAALVSTTFIVGLLPVVGNLVANTIMTVISLDHSLYVAFASLGFLIIIHKLEYIWSGRIIGTQVNAKIWELLVSMIILEHILGVPGLVIAPIFYAWFKSEWTKWDQGNAKELAN